MKESSNLIRKNITTLILILVIAAMSGTALLWFFLRGFGSRGVSPIQKSFDINGETLKAGHGIYVRYGEGYYLPLTETAALLDMSPETHFRGLYLTLELDGNLYKYSFHNARLTKNGESISDCGNSFMMKEKTVYVSTLFLEKALNCRIFEGGEEENRIYISNGVFEDKAFDYSWAESSAYIAHALGGVDSKEYTNSKEAFEESITKGFRNFEADLEYSTEGELVLIHSWERATLKELFSMNVPEDNLETPLSTAEFKAQKIYGKYTPLTFRELLLLMKEYPDMYLILDGKYDDEDTVRKEYRDIVKAAEEVDPELLKRLVPQIYNTRMYEWVMDAYDFRSMIFSWYKYGAAGLEPEPLFDFCEERGIKVCAMKDALENALLDKEAFNRDLYIFVYTVNNEKDRERLFRNGVKGIYTDFLFEDDE